jgi:hypothetical protein
VTHPDSEPKEQPAVDSTPALADHDLGQLRNQAKDGWRQAPRPTTAAPSTPLPRRPWPSGRAEVAARHAPRYAELIAEYPEIFTDWDRALAAEIQARTAAAVGAPQAADLKAHAQRLTGQVAEPDTREVVQDRLDRGPWFTLES